MHVNQANQFFLFAEQFVQFADTEKEVIQHALHYINVPKSHRLVQLGQASNHIYFVLSGCLRLYYLTDEGKDITGFVFTENMLAGSLESFLSQAPSNQVLETIEASELLALNHSALEQLYQKVPAFNIFIRKVLEMRMAHAQKLVASLIIHKPEERYTAYKDLHPQLEQRIPQHMLSTFMGITPVSLSRIRHRQLKKKD